ncbi:MAG: hypothetical protein JRE71_10240 [Deltaproteobacteria bacterium]|nr:hypothetical protein [Deltaproteobacteria bacterium]
MFRNGVATPGFINNAIESRAFWLAAATLLIFAHFARFYDANQALVTDTRYFTHFGIEVAAGAIPHLDFFDNKTQLASLAAGGLVHLGGVLGLGGLESIRIGYLGLAVLGGVLLFLLYRMIGDGRSIVGLLGLLPYLGFTYIGSLPATGSVPKLIMAVCATGAALAVARGRWFAAGVIAAIAPLDWQIGLFACLGVFAAAALDERPRRALLHSGLGVGLLAAVFVIYFALNGALEVMFAQTVAASFVRGAEAGGPFFKFAGIGSRLVMHCSGELWLVGLGIVGVFVYPLWFRIERWHSARKPLLMLAVYHYGVVGFSSIDFQGSGDTMLLLHSLAFFAGVTLVSLLVLLARFEKLAPRAPWPEVAVVVLMFALTHPVFSRYEPVSSPDSPAGVTLQDQLSFSRRLIPVLEDRSLLMLGPTELLLLGGFSHESIFVFWNNAAAFEYARTRKLESTNLLAALLAEYRPGAIITNRFFGLPPDIPYRQIDLGQPGGYAVKVYLRTEESSGPDTSNRAAMTVGSRG